MAMIGWFAEHAWLLSLASVLLFVVGLGAGWALILLIPADYFCASMGIKEAARRRRHPVWRLILRIGKNLAGTIVLTLGIIMAMPLVPGPGVLFILLGVSLLDVPGKRRVERYIISRPVVLRSVNRMRSKWHRSALIIPV